MAADKDPGFIKRTWNRIFGEKKEIPEEEFNRLTPEEQEELKRQGYAIISRGAAGEAVRALREREQKLKDT